MWLSEGVIDKKGFETLDKRMSSFDVPTGFGRLPNNISTNYAVNIYELHNYNNSKLTSYEVISSRTYVLCLIEK